MKCDENGEIVRYHTTLDTQASGTYDLEAHSRLTAKAFGWCENYALSHQPAAAAPQREEEEDEEDDEELEPQPQHGEESNIDVDGLGFQDDMEGSLGGGAEDEAGAEAPKQRAERVAPPNLKRSAAQPPVAKSAKRPGQLCVIDRITGGSLEAIGLEVLYRIEWEGFPHITNWWQRLQEPPRVDDDGMFHRRMVEIMELGEAPDLTSGRRSRKRASQEMVLGDRTDADGVRLCYESDGSEHRLDMLRCLLDEKPVDWLLSLDCDLLVTTDHIMDWGGSQGVQDARKSWGNGEYFPTVLEAKEVLCHLGDTATQIAELSPTQRQGFLQIALFLRAPDEHSPDLAAGHADALKKGFLDGGQIRDCLSMMGSLDKKKISALRAAACGANE